MARPSDALILLPQPLRLGRRGERAVPHRRGGAGSQSVKSTEPGGRPDYDLARKVNGRKRHTLVDTDGRGSLPRVSSAGVRDRDGGAVPLLRTTRGRFPFIARVFADTAYAAEGIANATRTRVPYR